MSHPAIVPDRSGLAERFRQTRLRSETLAASLTAEDMGSQSMPDASPTKWHLAHTTWFFATFLALDVEAPAWVSLFNSYYESLGHPYPRPQRGLLTRPGLAEIMTWRAAVTQAVAELVAETGEAGWEELARILCLGIAHEEQHQELILTDILHLFSLNPLCPAYRPFRPHEIRPSVALAWFEYHGGVTEIGHGGMGFAFDNEGPRHRVYLNPWLLGSRLVTNGEYLDFMRAGGYRRSEFWLSEGWATAQAQSWSAPPYWRWREGRPVAMTLSGLQPLDLAAPVSHVSYFEADAYARWSGKRLPTEAEWERAAAILPVRGNDLGSGLLRPLAALPDDDAPVQMFGDLWEWTSSAYAAYPGYRPVAGALGEYNGKFMLNQMVLRGGSCVSPPGHLRLSLRNFFPPAARWQFTGIRLAEDS